MLLKSACLAVFSTAFLIAQANAGIGLHYSGHSAPQDGQDFNFAVSSTNPSMSQGTDSPTEPSSNFFDSGLKLRNFPMTFGTFRPPMIGSGMGGGGGRGANGAGAAPRSFANMAKKNFGGGAIGSGGAGTGGVGSGGGGGVNYGGGTTSNDQTVNGTDGIVCVTDPGDGNDGGDGNSGGAGGGGGSPTPSAVPEPGTFAIWTLLTGVLIFGTRRMAS